MTGKREYGTIELLEYYWIEGGTLNERLTIRQRGIPIRSREDSKKLHRGEVEMEELRQKYLSEFQQNIVKELLAMERKDEFEAYREMKD